jgi:hypothetical protein
LTRESELEYGVTPLRRGRVSWAHIFTFM